jgi:hypothetical protein
MSDYSYEYTSVKGNSRGLGKSEAARRVGGRLALRRRISDARRQRRASATSVSGGKVTVQQRP